MFTHNLDDETLFGKFWDVPKFTDLEIIRINIRPEEHMATDWHEREKPKVLNIIETFPSSDKLLIRKEEATKEQRNRAADLLLSGYRNNPSCKCEDLGCPHKQNISPLAIIAAKSVLDNYTLNLSTWEPFKYPIFDFGDLFTFFGPGLFQSTIDIGNVWRLFDRYHIEGPKKHTRIRRGSSDFIEAIITDKPFEIYINEIFVVKITPIDKYNFLGMFPANNARFTSFSIILDSEEPTDIQIIYHMFRKPLRINEIRIISFPISWKCIQDSCIPYSPWQDMDTETSSETFQFLANCNQESIKDFPTICVYARNWNILRIAGDTLDNLSDEEISSDPN